MVAARRALARRRGPTCVRRDARRSLRHRARLSGPDEVCGAGARPPARRASRGSPIVAPAREGARPFYSETDSTVGDDARTSSGRTSGSLRVVGVDAADVEFPLRAQRRTRATRSPAAHGAGHFALLNPGAAWPNKRWPPAQFGEVAAFLRDGPRAVVGRAVGTGGGSARAVASSTASGGAAGLAPPTAIADLVALSREAAAGGVRRHRTAAHRGRRRRAGRRGVRSDRSAAQRPLVRQRCLVSRFESCDCHYERQCTPGDVVPRRRHVAEVDRGDPAAAGMRGSRRHGTRWLISRAARPVSGAHRVCRRRWPRSGWRSRHRAACRSAPRLRRAGEALRIWAAGHLEKGREVTASGPYRWTRHPLYLGSTIIGDRVRRGRGNASPRRCSSPCIWC